MLPAGVRERLAIATAEYNGCAYCLSAHTYIGAHLALNVLTNYFNILAKVDNGWPAVARARTRPDSWLRRPAWSPTARDRAGRRAGHPAPTTTRSSRKRDR